MSDHMLSHMKALGFSVECSCIALHSVAARFRVSQNSQVYQDCLDTLEEARHSDDAMLAALST
eukprot:10092184-Alexandrium_andersonii.AAC.1